MRRVPRRIIRRVLLAVLPLALFLPAVSVLPAVNAHAAPVQGQSWQNWQPGPPKYGYELENTSIPIPGGLKLAGIIAYPTTNVADQGTGTRAPGKFPVIVEYTPYPTPIATDWVHYGYISMQVRVLGTGGSINPGPFDFAGPESRTDGVTLVNYAASMPGSDGSVGMWGCSWPALQAMLAAAAIGPHSHLKAIAPFCNGPDTGPRQSFFSGGIPTSSVPAMLKISEYTGGQPTTEAYFKSFVANILSGGPDAYLGSFWRTNVGPTMQDMASIVHNNIPALLEVGWQDVNETYALAGYSALQNTVAGRPLWAPMRGHSASPRYQIIVGNWQHGGGADNTLALEWFDTWIKHMDTGMQDVKTTMHLFERGGTGRWIDTAKYPEVSHYSTIDLSGNGALTDGRPAAGQVKLTWNLPNVTSASVAYTTKPIAAGATLAGPIAATVYASSSNTNLELIGSLYDVAPDGAKTLITNGTVLGSLRQLDLSKSTFDRSGKITHPVIAQTHDSYLVPNRVYRFAIALTPTQWAIQPGHKLEFQLTTQAARSCEQDLLGTDPCFFTPQQLKTLPGGVYTIRTGRQTPSALNLPLLPYRFFATAPAPTGLSN